jgi:hypothetical protein
MAATGSTGEDPSANGPAGRDNALVKLKETVDAVLRRLPALALSPHYGIAYVTAPWWQNNPAAGLARESTLSFHPEVPETEHREAIERSILYADHLGLTRDDVHHLRQMLGDSTTDEEWQSLEFDPHPSDVLAE